MTRRPAPSRRQRAVRAPSTPSCGCYLEDIKVRGKKSKNGRGINKSNNGRKDAKGMTGTAQLCAPEIRLGRWDLTARKRGFLEQSTREEKREKRTGERGEIEREERRVKRKE